MTEQIKSASAPRPQYARDAIWYPLRSWWQPNCLFNQDFGMSAFLEPGELNWMQGLERRLSANTWPGSLPSPLFLHSAPGIMRLPKPRPSRLEQYVWRVSLDVGHFSPSELTLRTREGFLEIGGKHEERPDEHGFIARCFTRKYKLPIGVDPTQIRTMLSGDGVLIVEAPLPDAPLPDDIIIPIQVEKEIMGEERAARPEETSEASTETRHPPPSAPRVPDTPDLSSGEPTMEAADQGEALLESPGADGHPGNSIVEREDQEEEGKGREEETPAEHAVDPRPSGSADDEGLPESSEHQGALDDPDSPDTLTSDQGEHQYPAHHEEQPRAFGEMEAPEDPVVEQQELTK